jgi:hypothetical protein
MIAPRMVGLWSGRSPGLQKAMLYTSDVENVEKQKLQNDLERQNEYLSVLRTLVDDGTKQRKVRRKDSKTPSLLGILGT